METATYEAIEVATAEGGPPPWEPIEVATAKVEPRRMSMRVRYPLGGPGETSPSAADQHSAHVREVLAEAAAERALEVDPPQLHHVVAGGDALGQARGREVLVAVTAVRGVADLGLGPRHGVAVHVEAEAHPAVGAGRAAVHRGGEVAGHVERARRGRRDLRLLDGRERLVRRRRVGEAARHARGGAGVALRALVARRS